MQHLNRFYGSGKSTNIPWLLSDKESASIKEVVRKIKFSTSFISKISNILTNQGDFGGAKTHDWNTFIKV